MANNKPIKEAFDFLFRKYVEEGEAKELQKPLTAMGTLRKEEGLVQQELAYRQAILEEKRRAAARQELEEQRIRRWRAIEEAAQTNPAIKDLLDQLNMVYELSTPTPPPNTGVGAGDQMSYKGATLNDNGTGYYYTPYLPTGL